MVNKEEAQFAVLLITGSVCAIAAIIRILPLLRTLKTPQAKLISFSEIVLHLVLGSILIVSSFAYLKDSTSGFGRFVNDNFHLAIAIILYTRAVAYFWISVLYKEKTTKFNFWLHIIAITLAVIFSALRNLLAYHVAIALAIISIIGSVYLIVESSGGYWKYRKSIANAKIKEEQYHKEDGIKTPAKDESKIINEIDPSIIPIDDSTIDSTIIS